MCPCSASVQCVLAVHPCSASLQCICVAHPCNTSVRCSHASYSMAWKCLKFLDLGLIVCLADQLDIVRCNTCRGLECVCTCKILFLCSCECHRERFCHKTYVHIKMSRHKMKKDGGVTKENEVVIEKEIILHFQSIRGKYSRQLIHISWRLDTMKLNTEAGKWGSKKLPATCRSVITIHSSILSQSFFIVLEFEDGGRETVCLWLPPMVGLKREHRNTEVVIFSSNKKLVVTIIWLTEPIFIMLTLHDTDFHGATCISLPLPT